MFLSTCFQFIRCSGHPLFPSSAVPFTRRPSHHYDHDDPPPPPPALTSASHSSGCTTTGHTARPPYGRRRWPRRQRPRKRRKRTNAAAVPCRSSSARADNDDHLSGDVFPCNTIREKSIGIQKSPYSSLFSHHPPFIPSTVPTIRCSGHPTQSLDAFLHGRMGGESPGKKAATAGEGIGDEKR